MKKKGKKKKRDLRCCICDLTLEQQKQVGFDIDVKIPAPTEGDPLKTRELKRRLCGTCILLFGNLIDKLRHGGQWDVLVYHEQKKQADKKVIIPGPGDYSDATAMADLADFKKKLQ